MQPRDRHATKTGTAHSAHADCNPRTSWRKRVRPVPATLMAASANLQRHPIWGFVASRQAANAHASSPPTTPPPRTAHSGPSVAPICCAHREGKSYKANARIRDVCFLAAAAGLMYIPHRCSSGHCRSGQRSKYHTPCLMTRPTATPGNWQRAAWVSLHKVCSQRSARRAAQKISTQSKTHLAPHRPDASHTSPSGEAKAKAATVRAARALQTSSRRVSVCNPKSLKCMLALPHTPSSLPPHQAAVMSPARLACAGILGTRTDRQPQAVASSYYTARVRTAIARTHSLPPSLSLYQERLMVLKNAGPWRTLAGCAKHMTQYAPQSPHRKGSRGEACTLKSQVSAHAMSAHTAA